MRIRVYSFRLRFMFAMVFLWLAVVGPAIATDGVIEINQTCAVQTGCFIGDGAGYPIKITEPGSYRLTSNLIIPDENTDGIIISTSDVGIDLNNFAIIRSGCEGATTNCTPTSMTATGSGVKRISALNRGISLKNGSITGMGNLGVYLGDQAEILGLRVRWNRLDGIRVGGGSIVSGCTVYQNGDRGIVADAGSTLSGNTVYQNGSHGIAAFSGSTVQHNTARQNGGFGLALSSSSAYRENVISNNTTGAATGVDAGGNVCNGSTTCP